PAASAPSSSLYDAEREHRFRDAPEPGDVGAEHVVARASVLDRGFVAVAVDALHDLVQPLLRVVEGPRVAARVLLHLEGRGRDAARVRGFTRAVGDAGLLEHAHAARRYRHVRA